MTKISKKYLKINISKIKHNKNFSDLSILRDFRFKKSLEMAINSDYIVDFHLENRFDNNISAKDIQEEFKLFIYENYKKVVMNLESIRLIIKDDLHPLDQINNTKYEKLFDPQSFMIFFFSKSLFPNISVVTSFYDEAKNIYRFWNQLSELDNYLNIEEFVFINNGSKDETLSFLNDLKEIDSRIIIKSNPSPSTYAKGFTSAISLSHSEYTLITHSDCQFGLDTSIKLWLEQLFFSDYKSPSKKNIAFSKRLNRPAFSNLITNINSILAQKLIFSGEYLDFNAQPKLIPTVFIKSFMQTQRYLEIVKSSGYVFDLSLISHIFNEFISDKNEKVNIMPFIPVITLPRIEGDSSWQRNPSSYFINIMLFLKSILKESLL